MRNKATKSEQKRNDAFWEKENAANCSRKVDLDTIEYYHFTLDDLPIGICDSSEAVELEKKLHSLCDMRLLNLNGKTNTDLKFEYGPQNLEELTIYGDNYFTLENTMYQYGMVLYSVGLREEAIKVLERGIALPTDLAGNYTTLAEYYEEAGRKDAIENLCIMAEKNLIGFNKNAVLKRLKKILNPEDAEEKHSDAKNTDDLGSEVG